MTEPHLASPRVVLLGAGVVLCLTGPAPGEVGGCGDPDPIANAADFCAAREQLECTRAYWRGELPAERIPACEERARTGCAAVADWPPWCTPRPTYREARACLDDMRREDLLDLAPSEIPRCRLCPSPPGAEEPADAP